MAGKSLKMRIISGFLKGKKINYLKNLNTRPLKDSVKENIFNILIHSKLINVKIENCNVLDLYSGIGSFGIECISRGAKKVTFIEKNNISSNILKENLNKLMISNKSKIYNEKIESVIDKKLNEKFDIIFLDPPFNNFDFVNNLRLIKTKKFYNDNHLIMIHREIKTNDNLDVHLNIFDTKKYGRSKIIFGLFN